MVETPAAVQIIKDLIEEGIDFISFGTNDLTQYMLAIDRGNQKVQHLYDEMHPAVLYQLSYVIRVCKRYNVETSICGQAGSKKEMAKYLVENEIDSISVNADMAKEIADYVQEIEQTTLGGTDKEPRQYEVKKQEEEIEKTNRELEKVPEQTQEEISPENKKVIEEKMQEIKNENPEEKEKRIEKGVEAIDQEKQEYLKEHPKEKEETPQEEVKEKSEISHEEGDSEEEFDEDPEFKDEKEVNKKEDDEVLDIF